MIETKAIVSNGTPKPRAGIPMSTETKIETTLWERLTDGLSNVGEGVVGFLGRMFGSSNDRLVRSLGYLRPNPTEAHHVVPGSLLDQVNALEPLIVELRDDEFEKLTAEFRRRLGVEHKPLPKRAVGMGAAAPSANGHAQDTGPTSSYQTLMTMLEENLPKSPALEDILPYAFAACREAGRRTKNMRHFDTQIVGGVVLHRGNIAEMVTGEGKTLVATLPAYLNALEDKGVHIVTVNDYLARRDCEWMSPIYNLLGVSSGFIQSDMDPEGRRAAYSCDITYGTNSEFGFDYLRDNMKRARWGDNNYHPLEQQVQRGHYFAIIDEVDNILIDEARTPLIISGPAQDDPDMYRKANRIAVQLSELEKKAQAKLREIGHGLNIPGHQLGETESEQDALTAASGLANPETQPSAKPQTAVADDDEIDLTQVQEDIAKNEAAGKKERRLGYYFEVKEKERTCHLTDEGIRKAEELAGVESFYTAGNMEWPHLIDNALKAHHLYHRDRQYVTMPHPETREMSVIIVDEFTGRLMVGRQWSDGLHQAVEAKHEKDGVKIKEETQTLATITLQNYFKFYKKLAGMTGTAMTEANEFWKIYKLDVVAIPTNQPLIRLNYQDMIFLTEKEKWEAVVDEIERIHRFDVVYLNDGANLIGTVKKESDDSIDFETREPRERKTLKREDIDHIDYHGRPILIGTTDVDKSEKLSAMLKRRGIKHELLNAKPEYAQREAEIVAQAGRIGAVTISTNMAGRGTDIILGGNPETLAWARLKDLKGEDGRFLYATRLEVPDDVWKQTVNEIRTKEKMEEEGRKVAGMGGLHIVGTERHEARRIDNQLRGRAGRQGDPGSGRFFLSLQDDLMRIFAGEWVTRVLQSMGMEYGQAIESRMVSKRIEGAQKKVEERNFDIRKNLLEYDEVMDYQRKRVYGYRQEILGGANCKILMLKMIEEQLDAACDRFLADDYGPASFAELASMQLNVELEPSQFVRTTYEDAVGVAKDRALKMVQTQIQEAMDENLDLDTDASEWNWQAMSGRVNKLWELKTTDRQLKKLGRDNLSQYLIDEAEKHIAKVDLSKGAVYLQEDWGRRSLCDWMKKKFDLRIDPASIADKNQDQIKELLLAEVHKLYRQKEIEFPVRVAMARFMSEQQRQPLHMGGQRYDREGLLRWYQARFGSLSPSSGISEESFRTEPRSKLQELLVEASRKSVPSGTQADLDAKLQQEFEGAQVAEEGDAQELAEWVRTNLGLEVAAQTVTGMTFDQARNYLWNAYDERYRPEMKRVERGLLLDRLDRAWKNHLYVMDHLRQGIGRVGYAQIDPKTEYKRQGMKEFESMWGGLSDKVTDAVFRLEDDESFEESIWSISAMVHEAAPRPTAATADQEAAAASQGPPKKIEPIRNAGAKIGRNAPCPCGSGKKYKNCCMRQAVK
jgi:preprotein translocase subunit SecA